MLDRGAIANATVRERFRRPIDDGVEVLAEVFVSYGRQARVGTWRLVAEPGNPSSTRFDLRAIGEIAAIDGLIKLTMDRTKQFALHNFVFDAPDLTLKMPSGTAFVAESPQGITALVLLGDGEVVFSPDDPAEQGQLRILDGEPALTSKIEAAYIRMSPQEMETRAEAKTLVETRVDPRRLERAQEVFDLLAPRTFNLDLTGLSTDRWSLEPSPGNVVVEFRSRKFGWLTYSLAPNEAEDISVFDRGRGAEHRGLHVERAAVAAGTLLLRRHQCRVRRRALRARPGVRSGAVVVERTGGRARCARARGWPAR